MKTITKAAQVATGLLSEYYHLRSSHSPTHASARRLRDRILESNQGLVRKAAHRWVGQCSEPFDDLFQEGCLGLIKAIEAFDPSTGAALSSFAMPYINGAIQHYLRDKGWGAVRPPRRSVELYAHVHKVQREMEQAGRKLTADQVAAGLGISPERWQFTVAARTRKPILSLEEKGDRLDLEDKRLEEAIEQEAMQAWIYDELQQLPAVQRECLLEHVFASQNFTQIAKRRRLSEAVVGLLIKNGLERIRAGHSAH